MLNRFNIRSYALIIKDAHILLSYEDYNNQPLVKFPGGGVHFGESPYQALQRELFEELRLQNVNLELFHIPQNPIVSAFNPHDQLLPIYYLVHNVTQNIKANEHAIRWIPLKEKGEELNFTFTQDLKTYGLLQKRFL